MNRRRLLGLCIAAAVAGCTDTDDPAAPTDDSADGSDDSGNASDTDGDDEVQGDDGTSDGGDGTDGSDESADDQDGTADTGDPDDANGNGSAQLGETIEFGNSFAFTVEGSPDGGTSRAEGRIDGDNAYWQFEENGDVMELYAIGADLYWVQGEDCYRMDGEANVVDEEIDLERDVPEAEDFEEYDHVESVGTTTIDGEEMYVFELSADEFEGSDHGVTYYVSVDTGYLRRIEQGEMVMEFHEWGDVDTIEPPDMECVDLAEQGS